MLPVRTMKERMAQAAGLDLNTASMPRSSIRPARICRVECGSVVQTGRGDGGWSRQPVQWGLLPGWPKQRRDK